MKLFAANPDLVFRMLPDAYRRAGPATVARSLSATLADALNRLDKHSKQVLQSRFIDHLADLDDAERLAALFALVPWPEEDLGEFRHRVGLMARIYLAGAATASALLAVVGAATDSRLVKVVLPEHAPEGGSPINDRYTTTGYLARRADEGQTFTARVVEMPPIRQTVLVEPASDWLWEVDNPTFADPGDYFTPPTYPEPVVDLVAGERPVTLPVLVQRDLRRLVLINRHIPPGSTLRVDLAKHELIDLDGPPTLAGPLLMGGTPAPGLLYGTGGLASDVRANRLTDPPPRQDAARPFHILRWNRTIRTGPDIPLVPGPPGTQDPVPIANIPWPPLLGVGLSRWRLALGLNAHSLVPTLGEWLDLADLRVLPATPALGPARLQFHWTGRRLATFTVLVDDAHLCDGPDPAGKMQHRADWLHEQIRRLKLAGVLYIDPAATTLVDPPALPIDLPPALSLWEVATASDQVVATIRSRSHKGVQKEQITLTDAVSVTVTLEEE